MSDLVFEALRAAVNLSRYDHVRSTETLKIMLSQRGFDQSTINDAILFWAKHVRQHNQRARA
jgi:hypothetical protein